MQRDPRAFLWDVQQAAEAITQFTAGLDVAGYRSNPLIRSAVERQFEIIGEALNRLSKETPDLANRVPNLGKIIGFRNVLIHGYAVRRRRLSLPRSCSSTSPSRDFPQLRKIRWRESAARTIFSHEFKSGRC